MKSIFSLYCSYQCMCSASSVSMIHESITYEQNNVYNFKVISVCVGGCKHVYPLPIPFRTWLSSPRQSSWDPSPSPFSPYQSEGQGREAREAWCWGQSIARVEWVTPWTVQPSLLRLPRRRHSSAEEQRSWGMCQVISLKRKINTLHFLSSSFLTLWNTNGVLVS